MNNDFLERQIGSVYDTNQAQKVVVEGFYLTANPAKPDDTKAMVKCFFIDKGKTQLNLPDSFELEYSTFIHEISTRWGSPNWTFNAIDTLKYTKKHLDFLNKTGLMDRTWVEISNDEE